MVGKVLSHLSLLARLGYLILGVKELEGHFHQVLNWSLRTVLNLFEFFFFFLMSESDWEIK